MLLAFRGNGGFPWLRSNQSFYDAAGNQLLYLDLSSASADKEPTFL